MKSSSFEAGFESGVGRICQSVMARSDLVVTEFWREEWRGNPWGQALRKLHFWRDNSPISANIAYIIENENLMRNIIWKVERLEWMAAARRNTKAAAVTNRA